MAISPQVVMDWSTADQYFIGDSGNEGPSYVISNVPSLPGVISNPAQYYLTFILARFPGGEPFLIAVAPPNLG